MSHTRDPITTLILVLLLLVSTWIGFSLSSLQSATLIATGDAAQARSTETLARATLALERMLDARDVSIAGGNRREARAAAFSTTSAGGPAAGEGSSSRRPLDPEAVDRVSIAAKAPDLASDHESRFYEISRNPAPGAAAQVAQFCHSIRRGSPDRATARQSLYLMTRSMVLRRFGRPTSMNLTQTGNESWTWKDGQGNDFSLIFRTDYVVGVY